MHEESQSNLAPVVQLSDDGSELATGDAGSLAINMPRVTALLSSRQRLFVLEYMRDRNATQAAIRAGYSRTSARQMGSENLSKPAIAAEILRMEHEHAAYLQEEFRLDRGQVLRRVAIGALGDIRGLFDEHGHAKPLHQLSEDAAALIEGFEVHERLGGIGEDGERIVIERTFKYKISKRQRWADMAMRHLGEYRSEPSVPKPTTDTLSALLQQIGSTGSSVPTR